MASWSLITNISKSRHSDAMAAELSEYMYDFPVSVTALPRRAAMYFAAAVW